MEIPTPPVAPIQTSGMRAVTPLSKYLALVLFVLLPFVGGYVGYLYAPEKIVEIEKPPAAPVETISVTEAAIAKVLSDTEGGVRLAAVRATELDSVYANGTPKTPLSHVFITGTTDGGRWLNTEQGTCSVVEIRPDLLSYNPELKEHIVNIADVTSGVTCWYGGAGSETYLYKSDKSGLGYQVATFPTGECGNEPNCEPFGPVEVVY